MISAGLENEIDNLINYAKRQLTFMRKMENLEWFEKSDTQKIIKRVKEFLGE